MIFQFSEKRLIFQEKPKGSDEKIDIPDSTHDKLKRSEYEFSGTVMDSSPETKEISYERQRHIDAHRFFEEAIADPQDKDKLDEILNTYSDDIDSFLKDLAQVSSDRTNPYADRNWGKIRAALKEHPNGNQYKNKFNQESSNYSVDNPSKTVEGFDRETRTNSPERLRHIEAHEFFAEVSSDSPDENRLNEILDEHSNYMETFLKFLVEICVDRTNPYADQTWGKIRSFLEGRHNGEYLLETFNTEAEKYGADHPPKTVR